MRAWIVAGCCLATLAALAAAQHERVHITYPLSLPNPFQAPSSTQLGGTLSGRMLTLPVPAVTVTRADTLRNPVRTCPMPVLKPDTSKFPSMRVIKPDSTYKSTMPVIRPACVNPLNR
jgi:hypothetical protein